MELGYRAIRTSDVGLFSLQFMQISFWRKADWGVAEGEAAVQQALETAAFCRRQGIRTVFHPLEYPLTGEHAEEMMAVLRQQTWGSSCMMKAGFPVSACPMACRRNTRRM